MAESQPRHRSAPWAPDAWRAAILLGATTAVAFALDAHVSLTSLAMVYLLAVVLASYTLGWLASAATAVAAVTALNFFFVPPRWTLEVESRDHLIALTAMLAVSLVISHLARGLRRETALAHLNAQRAQQLQTLATELVSAGTPEAVHALGLQALEQAFAGPVWLALRSAEGDLALPAPDNNPSTTLTWGRTETDGLRQCMKDNAVLGPGTGRWPGLDGWYLPVGDAGHVLGAALVRPATAADTDGRAHASALAALLGQALVRLQLGRAMQDAQAQAQHQQLLNTFLAAISHDLRTPLAAIVGAGTSLQTQGERLPADARARLLDSIVSESSRLATLTDNTLQLVRLSSQASLPRQWESPEELVGAAVARVRAQDPARRVTARVQPGLPLLRADPVLLGQLLANLLDNALRYTTGPVQVEARREGEQLQISVKDRGPGIPPALQTRLFQPFSRGDQTGPHGAGLGLALCQAIAQAHGGQLTVRARQGGGTSFCLTLAVETQPAAAVEKAAGEATP